MMQTNVETGSESPSSITANAAMPGKDVDDASGRKKTATGGLFRLKKGQNCP
ncbi:MAG: hypothetical protein M0Z99_00225 [Betaproteobacteria bacterium]|nr:hypothetical protein [Betaproteobacteria bacterium]